ncbi:hypothetical protein NMY22_g6545 [Coprinellus aureogranulatus]|nr:hypothetical protein NMY22_g6545 [Coprinellus aureogranulatus]
MDTINPRLHFSISWTAKPLLQDDPTALSERGVQLLRLFESTGNLAHLSESISSLERAVQGTPRGSLDMPGRLNKLGGSYLYHFQFSGDLEDTSRAVNTLRRAVELTPEGDEQKAWILGNIGEAFRFRWSNTYDLKDLSEAISHLQGAASLIPKDHERLPQIVGTIGNLLQTRFEWQGDVPDISEAIIAHRRAVNLLAGKPEDLRNWFTNLGNSLRLRFERTRDLADLEEAIEVQEKALKMTPTDHANLPLMLNAAGNSYMRLFERTRDINAIERAIKVQRKASNLTSEGDPNLPSWLSNLGTSLLTKFRHTGSLPDIKEAVSTMQKAIRLTPPNDSSLPITLSNSGTLSLRLFELTGNLSDIEESITNHRRAVSLTRTGHANLPTWLSNLSISLVRHFERTGDLQNVEEAISTLRRIIEDSPQDNPDLPTWLSNLGISMLRRFERTHNPPDISGAISALSRAVHIANDGHIKLPKWLNNLSLSFLRRFESNRELADVSAAIDAQKRAVDLTLQGDPDLPIRLHNLGTLLLSRFECEKDASDIDDTIVSLEKAVRLTPEGHASMPVRLNSLGKALNTRYLLNGGQRDLVNSISNCKSAALYACGSPKDKLKAAQNWALFQVQLDAHSADILPAFDTAVSLIAIVGGLEQTIQGRYMQLEETSGIVLEAASAACRLGRPDTALEWLEQGRCLVWNQLNHLRSPLDDLRDRNPQLAQRIIDVSKLLDDAGSSRNQPYTEISASEQVARQDGVLDHLRIAGEWDGLVNEARRLSGFESFFKSPRCSTILTNLPKTGITVIINVGKYRCDALALFAGVAEPLHIPLPNLNHKRLRECGRRLRDQLGSHNLRMPDATSTVGLELLGERSVGRYRRTKSGTGGGSVRDVLKTLWDDLVKPVIDGLRLPRIPQGSPASERPRIWWCPTGALTFLPIHAAGNYGSSGSESILDYAVSSYTPNIAALTDRVASCRTKDDTVSGLFLTSQPSPPKLSSIPGTITEVQNIYSAALRKGVKVAKFGGDEITPEECLQYLEEFSCVHLACHGAQGSAESLNSRFIFQKGSLDLSSIIQRNLKHADLAFPSACQTSTGDERVSDEAVHLAGGMLAAGYRRVVATMWAIGDTTAQTAAQKFYEYLWKDGHGNTGCRMDGTLSAYALHHAVQELRKVIGDTDEALLAWAPFVHFGY